MVYFHCDCCNYDCKSKQNYDNHIKSKKHLTAFGLVNNVQESTNPTTKVSTSLASKCDYCNKQFTSDTAFSKHKTSCERLHLRQALRDEVLRRNTIEVDQEGNPIEPDDNPVEPDDIPSPPRHIPSPPRHIPSPPRHIPSVPKNSPTPPRHGQASSRTIPQGIEEYPISLYKYLAGINSNPANPNYPLGLADDPDDPNNDQEIAKQLRINYETYLMTDLLANKTITMIHDRFETYRRMLDTCQKTHVVVMDTELHIPILNAIFEGIANNPDCIIGLYSQLFSSREERTAHYRAMVKDYKMNYDANSTAELGVYNFAISCKILNPGSIPTRK